MAIKVEVVKRELIRPSSPTPSHLRSYQLSRFDQSVPLCYTSVILFYACNVENQIEISKHLKESLSNALPSFYPFAGRLKDNLSIDCNDEGVAFLEARVNCPISCLFKEPNLEAIRHLVPMESREMITDPQLLIQVNSFIGGGIGLGITISHKIADGTTLSTIIRAWADTAIGRPDAVIPDLSLADLYPSIESSPALASLKPRTLINNDGKTLRIVFEAGKIDSLKAKVKGTENPTRVEVVLALLLKCAIKASLESRTSYVMIGSANMRSYLVPPVPKYACGNVPGPLVVIISEEAEIELSDIVSRLRKVITDCRGLSPHSDYGFSLLSLENNKVNFSSQCRMPFYEADFGWGKPMWACYGVVRTKGFYLIDSQEGDGIEAWIKLNEQEMALFEKDEELMVFGSMNQRVRLR